MSLHSHVNNSGFPLQLAIANLVRKEIPSWNVLYEEHNWELESESGFIDLVIEDQYKTWLMNIECKRVRDSKWIFLPDYSKYGQHNNAKLWVSSKAYSDESLRFFDWVDVPVTPGTPQSSYCIVPGQDSKSKPMLERTAASVVKSTEALAKQEVASISSRYSDLRIYQNVIVTTAELHVCGVDINAIDLANGEIDDQTLFNYVPYIKFRKQVGASATISKSIVAEHELRRSITDRESTVFIVNSKHFEKFLDECELPSNLQKYIGM